MASVDTGKVCERGVGSREAPTHASEPTLPWTIIKILVECLSRSLQVEAQQDSVAKDFQSHFELLPCSEI